EWPGAGRSRRPGRARRHRRNHRHPARTTASDTDLGPRQRTCPTRPADHRHRRSGLLRRPAQPMATRHQRENTNGLLRQYFPKGTARARWKGDDLDAVAATLNSRPRKTLGWKTPAEALNELLLSVQGTGVATTG